MLIESLPKLPVFAFSKLQHHSQQPLLTATTLRIAPRYKRKLRLLLLMVDFYPSSYTHT